MRPAAWRVMVCRLANVSQGVLLAGAGTTLAGALVAAWGVLAEPRLLEQRRIDAPIPRLADAWDGAQVALLADFQLGSRWANVGTVKRATRVVAARRPAAALIAGDLVYQAPRDERAALSALREVLLPLLSAAIPTFAVLGNHDYALESPSRRLQHRIARRVADTLEACGVTVLHNDAVPLTPPGGRRLRQGEQPLYLVGVGPHLPHEDRPLRAVSQVPGSAPRVVLMHNPASFPALPAGSAPLALAGHTHGGQIRLPFKPDWGPARFVMPWPQYVDGWIEDYGQAGNRLYINRGIGFSRWPIRFGCLPEVTCITLQGARDVDPAQPRPEAVRAARTPPSTSYGRGLRTLSTPEREAGRRQQGDLHDTGLRPSTRA